MLQFAWRIAPAEGSGLTEERTMIDVEPIAVDVDASTLAFRTGQAVEQLPLDRGIELARRSGCSVAATEHLTEAGRFIWDGD